MVSPTPDPTERFSERANYYEKYRPGYPEEMFDLLVRKAGLNESSVVADIGAGTGFSSEPFLRRGFHVVAVEPNQSMRKVCESLLESYPRLRTVGAVAEHTTLPDAAAALVLAATAFHWFHPAGTRKEFRRILQPGGVAALVWNRRAANVPGVARDYNTLLLHHAPEYTTDWSRKKENSEGMAADFFENKFHEAHFPHSQTFDFEGLQGRLLSASYAPMPGSEKYEPMIGELRTVFDQHQKDGMVEFQYDCCVYWNKLL